MNKLDAFALTLGGRVRTAAWQYPYDAGKPWRGWWVIDDAIEAAPCAPVTGVSKATDHLDVFVVGLDGHVYGAHFDPATDWRKFLRVGTTFKTVLHGPVSAVSRSPGLMDLFAVGRDGIVYTTAWAQGVNADGVWPEWWRIATLPVRVPPGAPVSAVCPARNKLAIFVVGSDGTLYWSAWPWTDPRTQKTAWRPWEPIGGLRLTPRTPVCAIATATDRIELFAQSETGRVYTVRRQPNASWGAWGPTHLADQDPAVAGESTGVQAVSCYPDRLDIFVGERTTTRNTSMSTWTPWTRVSGVGDLAVSVVSRAMNVINIVYVGANGRVGAKEWTASTGWAQGSLVGTLVTGISDPKVKEWTYVGTRFKRENSEESENAQGIVADGKSWFMTNNGSKFVARYDNEFKFVAWAWFTPTIFGAATTHAHVGAPGYYEGIVYIPIQKTSEQSRHGVWTVRADFSKTVSAQSKFHVDPVSYGGAWAWCDVNPLNGQLYTATKIGETWVLVAYDREALVRCSEDDIHLGFLPAEFYPQQGGCFTPRGRVLFVATPSSSGQNTLWCCSAINGLYQGGQTLGTWGSSSSSVAPSEVESVTVASLRIGNADTTVQILELDNDWIGGDDAYLHSYSVPEKTSV